MPLTKPPQGTPINKRDISGDLDDAAIMRSLKRQGRCQQRLLTDRGQHVIFCGGYYLGPAIETRHGLRCKFHRPRTR